MKKKLLKKCKIKFYELLLTRYKYDEDFICGDTVSQRGEASFTIIYDMVKGQLTSDIIRISLPSLHETHIIYLNTKRNVIGRPACQR